MTTKADKETMTTTILTDKQVMHLWDTRVGEPCDKHPLTDADKLHYARAIEQAVLQSPEVQALRKDAGRYRWLRDGGNDDIGVVRGFGSVDCGSTSVASTYEEGLSGEQLDEAIDDVRRVEGEGE